MAELSPEEKAEMIAKAKAPSGLEAAAAEAGALSESTDPAEPISGYIHAAPREDIAAEQARVNTESAATLAAAKAREEQEKNLPTKPTTQPSREGTGQAVSEWGPYDDYVIVTTPYGQFAVPKGEIMHFEETQQFSNRARGMVTVHVPRYRDAKTGLTRDPISGNYYDPSLTRTAEQVTVR